MITKKKVKDYYSKLSEDYDKIRFGNKKAKFISSLQIRWVLHAIQGKKGIILDVGCGTGRISLPLLFNNNFVVGVDIEKRMIKILQQRIKRLELWKFMNCIIADIEHLPFKDNTFDVVTSLRVIWHMPNYEDVLQGIVNITKKGGMLLIDFPNATGVWAFISHIFHKDFEVLTQFIAKDRIEKIGHKYNLGFSCSGHVSPVLYLVPMKTLTYVEKFVRKIELLGNLLIVKNLFAYYLIKMTKYG